MPEYLFVDHDTKKEWLQWMGITEAEEYLAANPNVERLVHGAPRLVSKTGSFGHNKKPDDAFRDILKGVKRRAGKKSTINTW